MQIFSAMSVWVVLNLVTGCNSNHLIKESFFPTKKATAEFIVTGVSKKVYCGLEKEGLNPGIPPKNVIWVGYQRLYNAGTKPFPCPYWGNAVYRGAFFIDLLPLQDKHIASAVLHFSISRSEFHQEGFATNGPTAWVKQLMLATSDWRLQTEPHITSSRSNFFPAKAIPGLPNLPYGHYLKSSDHFPVKFDWVNYEVEVSNLIRDMLQGKEVNLGFVLVGPDESVDYKNNNKGFSVIDNIFLDVLYSRTN